MADPEVPEWAEEVPDWATEVPQPTADELNAIFAQAQAEHDAQRQANQAGRIEPGWRGAVQAGVRGANQGATMGFADEILGAVESRFPSLAQMPGDVLADLVYPETVPQSLRTQQAPTYEEARNAQRALEAETLAQRPGSYLAGQVAGGIAASRKLPSGFLSNVAQGAVQGVGDTEGESLGDMASGAARGAAFAGGADLAGRGIGKYVLPAAMSRLRNLAERYAIKQGRKALENTSNVLANRTPLPDESVLQALEDRAIRMFGTAETALEGTRKNPELGLKALAERRSQILADILTGLEREGVQGPNAQELAEELLRRAEAADAVNVGDKTIPALYRSVAEDVRGQPPPGFTIPERGLTGARQQNIGLTQAEATKRNLQKKARLDKQTRTGLDDTRADIASLYRQRVEDAVGAAGRAAPEGSEVANLADEFVPAKRILGRTIAAREAAKRGATKASNRSTFDLGDKTIAASQDKPWLMVMAGLLANQARNRGASTAADLAYRTSRAAGDVTREAITNPRTVQDWMARLLAVPSRQEVLAEYLRSRNRQPPTTQE